MEVAGSVDFSSACLLTLEKEEGGVKSLGHTTAGQLHKAVMDTLKSVHPCDTTSFSCLITCAANLCFQGQYYAQMPNIDINSYITHTGTENVSKDSDVSRASYRHRVVFGPVDANLRKEVEQYLIVMMSPPDPSVTMDSTSVGKSANPAKQNKVVTVKPFHVPFFPASNERNYPWFATALAILSKHFVVSNCHPALLSRLGIMFPSCAPSLTSIDHEHRERTMYSKSNAESASERNGNLGGKKSRGNFLVSLAKMMSLSIEYDEDDFDNVGIDVDGNATSGRSESKNDTPQTDNSKNIQKDRSDVGGRNSILTLMKLSVVYSSVQVKTTKYNDDDEYDDIDEERISFGSWDRFHLSTSTLQLLAAAMKAGLPALRQSRDVATVRNCFLISGI